MKFYTNGNKVIAVGYYDGKAVRGIAKCSTQDTFNLEKGKQLAEARCALKIALKRAKNIDKEYDQAIDKMHDAMEHKENISKKVNDAYLVVREKGIKLDELLRELG